MGNPPSWVRGAAADETAGAARRTAGRFDALALQHIWQYAVLAAAAVWLLAAHRSAVIVLLAAAGVGVAAALARWSVT